jgi:hypothetical protein
MSCSCFEECVYESTAQSFPFMFLFSLIILFALLIFKVYTLQTQVLDLEAKIDLIKIFVKSKLIDDVKEEKPEEIKENKKVGKDDKKSSVFEKKTLSEIFQDLKSFDVKKQTDLHEDEDFDDDEIDEKVQDDKLDKDEDKEIENKEIETKEKEELKNDIKVVKKKVKKTRI